MNKVKSSLWQLRPDEYLNRFLEKGVRCDGRKPEVCRAFKLEVNKSDFDSIGDQYDPVKFTIRAGNSSYICSCTPQIIRTNFEEKTNELITNHRIVVNLDLPPICGFSGNSNYSTFVSNKITECLNDQRVINKNAFMSICDGKELQWVFNVNIVCLSYDGNPLDYALMLTVASIINTKIPSCIYWDANSNWFRFSSDKYDNFKVENNQESSGEGGDFDSTGKSAYLKNIPVFVSFAYINGKTWVCDPNNMEDSQGEVVSFCDIDGENVTLHTQCITDYQPGELHTDLGLLMNAAKDRARNVRAYLQRFQV